jgi:recombination protein RecA
MSEMTTEEKLKKLDAVHNSIDKKHGKNTIRKLNSDVEPFPSLSSGILELDEILGIGGYPLGRIVEIYGPESGGKTTIALHAIAETQKNGGICAFVDAEHALDPKYAQNLGVNLDELWLSQPDTGEAGLDVVQQLVESEVVSLIVVDSVSALTPEAEINGEMGDSHMGLQARLMSQAMRKLTGAIGKSNTVVIFINQIRMKIGVMFGSPETTTGGRALKFYASVRIDVRRKETLTKGEDAYGTTIKLKTAKNKVASPFRLVEVENTFGKGVTKLNSILNLAVKYELIDKAGSWYSYGEEKIGQGRENAKLFLEKNPDIANELELKIKEKILPEFVEFARNEEKVEAPKRRKKADKKEEEIEVDVHE